VIRIRVRAFHAGYLKNVSFSVEVGNATISREVSWLRANAKARILAKAIHGNTRSYEIVDLWSPSPVELPK
jgi:hypothetical protein